VILEWLQPGPSALDAATVLLRAGYHVATVGTAGLVIFAIGFGERLEAAEAARLRRWVVGGAALGIALTLLALALRVLALGTGLLDGPVWEAVLRSRIGDAAGLRLLGLALLPALLLRGAAGPALAAAGALLALMSYAAMGHSTLYRPRQEIAALVVVHLLAVAFWVGALPPLLWVAGRPGGAALLRGWGHAATWAVGAMLASGALLAVLLTVRMDRILDAWHGWALLAKLVLVLGALALALANRLRHVPALERGEARAGARLARSIRWEVALVLLAFWAAAELTSVHPVDFGHRVGG